MSVAINITGKNLEKSWRDADRLDLRLKRKDGPVISSEVVKELREIQSGFREEPHTAPKWMIISSEDPNGFCRGRDIDFISRCVRAGDKESLGEYAHNCIDVLMDNIDGMGAGVITIGVIEGDAMGIGFETALSFDYLVARPNSRFGLPEVKWGLFPGMGAHVFLGRKIGMAMAARFIREGQVHTGREMHDLGIVSHLAEDDDTEAVVQGIIAGNARRHASLNAVRKAMLCACPVVECDLRNIADIWVDSVMKLNEDSLFEIENIAMERRQLAVEV